MPRQAIDPHVVVIGERTRREAGDLEGLARSIDEVGLLHPIVVTPEGRLIAGARRLVAWGMTSAGKARRPIPCRVVDLDAVVRGEAAENLHRKDFTLSEAVAIARALRPFEEEAAERRMKSGEPSANLAGGATGEVRDRLGKVTGYGRTTLAKAEEVVRAAEADPVRFGPLKAKMDETGRVDGPHKRLIVARKAEAIRSEPPPLPQRGPYRCLVADPPWPYEIRKEDPSHRATFVYPQMSIAEICGMDVASIAHADSILWLWTTNHHMREAFAVLDAWGFSQKTILTWAKETMGYGDWLRGQTEHALMCVRGKPTVTLTNQTTLLRAPVTKHSEKPDSFYEFVESLCPAPRYAELFSRRSRERWDGHGDEAEAA